MIDTGKVASNSSSFIKQIKEQDNTEKSSKISKDSSITSKLLQDFPEIKNDNQNYKNRLQNINNELTSYENELSKTQFVEDKIKSLEDFVKNNNPEKIKDLLNNTVYNNEKILKEYFTNDKVTLEQLEKIIQAINSKYSELNNQFKAIEIKSQNIISLYSYPMNVNDKSISNLNLEDVLKSTQINQKRVMDLIS